MPNHSVSLQAPTLSVGKNDVIFSVKGNKQKLGKLKISRGGVEWMPKGNSTFSFHLDWEKLAQIFENDGKKTKTKNGEWG